jgi:acyl-CoA dehydrogenase
MVFGSSCPGLTQGFMSALLAHASPDIKAAYLRDVIAGKATGTMNLTEAHAGSDVGLFYARARKEADGSYRVTGSKVFISAGEHDLVENILHLVLARIEGAPAGSKGLSLFMVPKLMPPANGSSRELNGVSCGSIEKKMGIHGNCTCVLNFDEAAAWLIGEENRGLPLLFTMMNHARMFVGIQGVALAEVAKSRYDGIVNLRAAWRSRSGRWLIDLFAKNVTDKRALVNFPEFTPYFATPDEFANPQNHIYLARYSPVRSYGISFTINP